MRPGNHVRGAEEKLMKLCKGGVQGQPSPRHRITNGFAIGVSEVLIQVVLVRV